MKSTLKIFSLAILSFVFFACGTSSKVASQATSEAKASMNYAPTEKALLWKIEKAELTSPSYLFGTIHIIPKDDFFYPTGTLSAIEATKTMVFEIDMSVMSDMSQQMALMGKAVMKDGKKLSDLLSDEEYAVVKNHFDKMGLPIGLFERMKPAFLTIFASEDMSPQVLQNGDMKSYEMEFLEIGESKEMGTGGLETVEYQLSVFDSIPYTDQAKMLVESIQNAGEGEDDLAKMISIYKDQDLKGMQNLFSDESMGDMDILLNNRNKNWIAPMKEYMSKSPTFFAVGAGHLVGEEGVIALLRGEGYTVTPVSANE